VNQCLPRAAAEQDFSACYEQLRFDALHRTSSGGVGLALFLRQGMAAWIQACPCGARLQARDSVPVADVSPALPADVRSQVTVILAGLVLHSRPKTNL
jgi:hypothetical protein